MRLSSLAFLRHVDQGASPPLTIIDCSVADFGWKLLCYIACLEKPYPMQENNPFVMERAETGASCAWAIRRPLVGARQETHPRTQPSDYSQKVFLCIALPPIAYRWD